VVEKIVLEAITRQMQDKNIWEQAAQIYEEKVVPDQLDCLLQ